MKRHLISITLGLCLLTTLIPHKVGCEEQECAPMVTLADSFLLALLTQEEVKIANLRVCEAKLAPLQAISGILPKVWAEALVTIPKESITIADQEVFPDLLQQYLLKLSQPLVDMRFATALAQTVIYLRAIERRSSYQIQEFLFQVSAFYFDVLRLRQLISVQQAQVSLAKQQLELVDARYDAGEVPETDRLRAESELTRAERMLVDVQSRHEVARARYANVVGMQGCDFELVEPKSLLEDTQNPGPCLPCLVQIARAWRDDLRSARLIARSDYWNVQTTKRTYWPSVHFDAEQEWVSPATFSSRNNFYLLYFKLNVPLISRGERIIETNRAKYQYRINCLEAQNLSDQIEVDVTQAWYAVRTLGFNVSSFEKEVELQKENYRITAEQYAHGEASSLDLVTSFNVLFSSEADLVTERYAHALARLELSNRLGLFWRCARAMMGCNG